MPVFHLRKLIGDPDRLRELMRARRDLNTFDLGATDPRRPGQYLAVLSDSEERALAAEIDRTFAAGAVSMMPVLGITASFDATAELWLRGLA
jgi:hypothetical protein